MENHLLKNLSSVLNGCENKAGQGQGTEVAASLLAVEETNRNKVWASAKDGQHQQHQAPSYSTATQIRITLYSESTSFTCLCPNRLHSLLSFTFFAKKTDLSHRKIFIAKETPCLNQSTTNSSSPIIPCNFPQSLSCLATELSLVWLPARFLSSFLVSRKNLENTPGQLKETF